MEAHLSDPEKLAQEMISDAVSETASKVLESTIAINLLNPVAVEVGQFLGDLGSLIRFCATDNLARIFTKWAATRKGQPPLRPEQFKRVMPLLQLAAMQSDDELQKRWAALLNSVSLSLGTFPSFGNILAQLTPDEAQFLDALWFSIPPGSIISGHIGTIEEIVRIREGLDGSDTSKPGSMDSVYRADSVKIPLDDLERLGLM